MKYGTTFSTKYCEAMKLDWEKVFRQMLIDLKFKSIRLCAYWDQIEPTESKFNFEILDKQLGILADYNIEITIALGRKVPRWPEFHEPKWLDDNHEKREKALIKYIEVVVNRYKKNNQIKYWQVENEPFWGFGETKLPMNKETVKKEVSTVKNLDKRPIIITDSRANRWSRSSKYADRLGVNVYSKLFEHNINNYVLVPQSYYKFRFYTVLNIKNIFISELQAEPWGPKYLPSDLAPEEASKTMNSERLIENINLAKKLWVKEVWLWGVEWWYFENYNGRPEVLETAKDIINV